MDIIIFSLKKNQSKCVKIRFLGCLFYLYEIFMDTKLIILFYLYHHRIDDKNKEIRKSKIFEILKNGFNIHDKNLIYNIFERFEKINSYIIDVRSID